MVINHNISALNTFNQLSKNEKATASSLQKLSSGLRINSAADDAAGLAISQKMTAQVNGLDQAKSNAQNGISFVQTAEGGLNETQSILQRMRELAVQSSNDTNKDVDRGQIQKEVDQLASEITDIANDTEFNSQKLLNGGISDSGISHNVFQVGANAGQELSVSVGAMDAKTLGVARDVVAGKGSGNVDSANFTGTTGSKVVDGANLSFNFAEGSTKLTGSSVTAPTTDMTGTTDTMKITVNGTDYTVKASDLATLTGSGKTITDVENVLKGAKDGAGTLLSSVTGVTIGDDGSNHLTISANKPNTTISVALTDTDGKLATLTGLASTDAAVSTSSTVTIADTKGNSQAVNVGDTDTGLSVTSGDFSGLSISLKSGKTAKDLTSGTDSVAVSVSTAAAATFAAGALVSDAKAVGGIDVSSRPAASAAITTIDNAIKTVSDQRSQLGAYENRLDHTINNLGVESQNLQSASSQITDVDMAQEMMTYTKNNILNQAAQAMLAQANQLPQGVLQLLK